MLEAIALSFQSLSDRRIQAIMVKVVLLTLCVFILLGFALWWLLGSLLAHFGLSADSGTLTAITAFASTAFSTVLLFRLVAVAITWIFADDIIDAVEARHYPIRAEMGKRPGVFRGAHMAIISVLRAIGYNLLALPLYALLLITGIGLPIAFLTVNALLLGRDLEDMLSARHGKAHGAMGRGPRFLLGLAGTAAMLIPFVNLVVPVIATAAAVHYVHRRGKI